MNNYIASKVDGITLVSSVGGFSLINGKISMGMDSGMGSGMGSGMDSDMNMGTEVPMDGGVKNPPLSSWVFVTGITTVTLAISVGIGILLAKRKIKKGFELYED